MAAFALQLFAYSYTIVGGGLTRAFGMLFRLLALERMRVTYANFRVRYALLSALLLAATFLSHPEWGLFAAVGMVLLLIEFGLSKRAVLYSGTVLLAAAVLSAPWWATAFYRYGVSTFALAFQRGASPIRSLVALFIAPSFDPFALIWLFLGVLGVAWCLGQRSFLLPVWLPITYLLHPRGA